MKKWKDDLKQGFTAPPPRRKEAFLSQFAPMHLSLAEVVMLQARYIRKWTWVASAVVLVIALMTLTILPKDGLWAVSGMTPLLALVVVTESGRSQSYRMVELEMATRFSLRCVTLARLVVLGTVNVLIMAMIVLMGIVKLSFSPWAVVAYMGVPYLLTATLGLTLVRHLASHDGMMACVIATLAISVSGIFLHSWLPMLYQPHALWLWFVCLVLLVIGVVKQCRSLITGTEGLLWRLS